MVDSELEVYMVSYQAVYGLAFSARNIGARNIRYARTFLPAKSKSGARSIFYESREQIKERECPKAHALIYRGSKKVNVQGHRISLEEILG